jgi:hypothetical protein
MFVRAPALMRRQFTIGVGRQVFTYIFAAVQLSFSKSAFTSTGS